MRFYVHKKYSMNTMLITANEKPGVYVRRKTLLRKYSKGNENIGNNMDLIVLNNIFVSVYYIIYIIN